MPARFYLVGVDLGQAADPTAIVVVEAIPSRRKLRLRHAERAPLYEEVADAIIDVDSLEPNAVAAKALALVKAAGE